MQTREIPKEQWNSYLDDFNRVHLGRLVRMETRQPGAEGQLAADNLPLVGITPQEQLPESQCPQSLAVIVGGDSEEAHLRHHIEEPTRLWIAEREGIEQAIQIEGRNGSITLLHLGEPLPQAGPQDFA